MDSGRMGKTQKTNLDIIKKAIAAAKASKEDEEAVPVICPCMYKVEAYVKGTLDTAMIKEIKDHLAICEDCLGFLAVSMKPDEYTEQAFPSLKELWRHTGEGIYELIAGRGFFTAPLTTMSPAFAYRGGSTGEAAELPAGPSVMTAHLSDAEGEVRIVLLEEEDNKNTIIVNPDRENSKISLIEVYVDESIPIKSMDGPGPVRYTMESRQCRVVINDRYNIVISL